ncbi:hypothetical protein CC85DRAFT_62416 [Cutaneotrichosporon oleaginosum]|uniref:Dynactin subunit 6 n=1 Tax=Cutaneotrichosporon oleaginosum TaxID=879819 RepID=A0A0J0XQD6_9TREE|nr:uncharacterized protein CC85DRAFT_62416 [Cutaneotrichosporon oleaginosum]KLT43336.1 hypothetical protein CC85DRAFT_62416 [Cutaneotrichosporon oleaginosum]TXT14402.1 hypothetical protein COLE_00595 [Cutaneotrichosporon oleaginosum]
MPQAPSLAPLPPDAPPQTSPIRPSFASAPRTPTYPSSSSSPRPPSSPTRRSPTKRRLALRAGHNSFVAAESRLEGTITLGQGCVVHPKATIMAVQGASIYLADGVVIEEMAEVIFRHPGRATIGTGTVVMVGAIVDLVPDDDQQAVGEWCTLAPRSRCLGVRVGNACTIGAGTSVSPSHSLVQDEGCVPDRTVIYGAASAARTWGGSGETQEREVRVNATAFLREILPKFNKAREEAPGIISSQPQPQR